MDTKHTPGPWTVTGTPGTTERHPEWSIESDYGQVAEIVTENCDTDAQIRADADLIAAAPTLLAACEAALDLLSLSYDTPSRAAIPQLRAAIAAAKGGEA